VFAWQGWQISIPAEWNPQRLEGNFDAGFALLSDLHGPRLGLRWRKIGAKDEVEKLIDAAMRDEVGQLAGDEARSVTREGFDGAKRYLEPDPPGRDIWMGVSGASGRLVQLSLQRGKGERSQLAKVVETLHDGAKDEQQIWSVFDLNCTAGKDWKLMSQALNAGDLALSFARGSDRLVCRQLALASLALKRQPIERWLRDISSAQRLQYSSADGEQEHEIVTVDGRKLSGKKLAMRRKRWLAWLWHLPRDWHFAVYHDATRDRLILGQSTCEEELQALCRSCGSVQLFDPGHCGCGIPSS
jgi:hypothetical protein